MAMSTPAEGTSTAAGNKATKATLIPRSTYTMNQFMAHVAENSPSNAKFRVYLTLQ